MVFEYKLFIKSFVGNFDSFSGTDKIRDQDTSRLKLMRLLVVIMAATSLDNHAGLL